MRALSDTKFVFIIRPLSDSVTYQMKSFANFTYLIRVTTWKNQGFSCTSPYSSVTWVRSPDMGRQLMMNEKAGS